MTTITINRSQHVPSTVEPQGRPRHVTMPKRAIIHDLSVNTSLSL